MALLGLIVGIATGQCAGAAAYRAANRRSSGGIASIVAGLVTAVCSALVFVLLGVHRWLAGSDAVWHVSVFLGCCFGICQAVLFKDGPLGPKVRRKDPPSDAAGA